VIKYIVAHWRGQQGLIRTCLLNGIALSILIVVVTSVGVIAGSYITVMMGGVRGTEEQMADAMVFRSELVFVPLVLIIRTWQCVGTFRCGLRNLCGRTNPIAMKFGGVAALVLGVELGYLDILAVKKLVGLFSA
jgi:hypothetical protein